MRILQTLIVAGGALFPVLLPAAATVTTLYEFSGGYDGSAPEGAVTVGSGGVLYGTANTGGEYGAGVVYSLTPPASAGGVWTQTVLHEFDNLPGSTDGGSPTTGLVTDSRGVLYGTTFGGGSTGNGTVFSLTPPASPGGAWGYAVLYSFAGPLGGGGDGAFPQGNIALAGDGVLYGTTYEGGEYGVGAAYSLTPPEAPGAAWHESPIYSFNLTSDGRLPVGGLLLGPAGILYGTTYYSTITTMYGSCCGTVFSLTPPTTPGGAWREQILFDFGSIGGDGGAFPAAGLTLAKNGVLYGTTSGGEVTLNPGGVVFSLTPPAAGSGPWTESVLYSFLGKPHQRLYPDGGGPLGTLLLGPSGALIGTTSTGGGRPINSSGTVFELAPPSSTGGTWTFTKLYTFTLQGPDQITPYAGLTIGPDGLLYGTTTGFEYDRAGGVGTVFSLTP